MYRLIVLLLRIGIDTTGMALIKIVLLIIAPEGRYDITLSSDVYSLNVRNVWKETTQYALGSAPICRTFLKLMLAWVDATLSTQLSLSRHVRNYVSFAHLCLIYEEKNGVPCATTSVMLYFTFFVVLCHILEI